MTTPLSASSAFQPHWDYVRTGIGRSGRSLSENNFAKERRDWLAILLREILQNALDARRDSEKSVHVLFRLKKLSADGSALLKALVPPDHLSRLKESMPHLAKQELPLDECLVVEDFGTIGLTGTFEDPEADGKGQNWNAFWFGEGEGGKENSSGNGGAGQGKITYFSTSAIRTLFAYTVRSDDQNAVLFGASSFLRDYKHGGHKWKRDSYWGVWDGAEPNRRVLPIQDVDLAGKLRSHFGMSRKSDQPGLSLLIPSPKNIDLKLAVEITIAEFFLPIFRGHLSVMIGDQLVDQSCISLLADSLLSDERAKELHTCTTKAYRTFLSQAIHRSSVNEVVEMSAVKAPAQISGTSFGKEDFEKLKLQLGEGDLVSVRVAVPIKKRDGAAAADCHFDVHLTAPQNLEEPEQAVIRKDLLIGEEPIGGGKIRQRVRALTFITDAELSKLLLAAEEPTHLRWNTKLPRLAEYYTGGAGVVAVVRNAAARILDVLTEGDQQRDFKLLAKYFSAPAETSASKSGGSKYKDGKAPPPPPNDIPRPKQKLLAIKPTREGCEVHPAYKDALSVAKLPIEAKLEFAYEGIDKDAFAEYDPLDFDLVDKSFKIVGQGFTVVDRSKNTLVFSIEATQFEIGVSGFDPHLRLRIRLSYEESQDAKAVEAQ